MTWGRSARSLWEKFYASLSDDNDDLTSRLTDRGEAHVLRVAMLYAVADQSPVIALPHLEAALAVWDYCVASVAWIWGASLGNPHAERILKALRTAEQTRTDLRGLFSGHLKEPDMEAALHLLQTRGLAEMYQRPTGGRPTEVWRVPPATEAQKAQKGDGLPRLPRFRSGGPLREQPTFRKDAMPEVTPEPTSAERAAEHRQMALDLLATREISRRRDEHHHAALVHSVLAVEARIEELTLWIPQT